MGNMHSPRLRIVIFLFFSLLFVEVLAQKEPVLTVNETVELSLLELLKKVSDNDVNIIYSPSLIPDKKIILKKDEYGIEKISKILEQYGLNLIVQGSHLLVTPIDSKHTLSGYVKSIETGDNLIGAVVIVDNGKSGTVTNNYGYFSMELEKGKHSISAHFIGFEVSFDSLNLLRDSKIEIYLNQKYEPLKEVVVSDISGRDLVLDEIPGKHELNYRNKGQIPYFLGEVDVLQESLLLPGITSLGEDASGINIRGGDIDQNLYLLDEATIYNPNHFYGLISVFNPEAVNKVNVMKGYIPASYGGRASSVISIYQREGNINEYNISGGIGLVSARATVEGPIKEEVSSFLISGRQSLLDLSLEDDALNDNSRTSFQDLNAKVNWKLNDKNTFYLSGYFGNDRNRAGFNAVRNWGNRALTLRWNHTFSPKLFSHFSGVISEYNYRITNPVEAGSFIGRSLILNYGFKNNNHFYINPRSHLEFGLNMTYHLLRPGERVPFDENSSQKEPLFLDPQRGLENAVYIQHDYQFNRWLSVNYGFRIPHIINFGKAEVYEYDSEQPKSDFTITDTTNYQSGEKVYEFLAIEPRITFNIKLTENISLKPSYVRLHQFLHLISNTAAPAPTDIWKLTGEYIPPLRTDQFSLGIYQYLFNGNWELSVEGYYKDIDNVIDYKNNADLLFNPNLETELITGEGRVYGLEILLNKRFGRFTGWTSYTLSRAERRLAGDFPEETINDGAYFPEDFDKTHNLSVVGVYDLGKRLSLSASFNFHTGRPITLPSGKYSFNGILVPHFEGRNQNRLENYHRLDLSARLNGKKVKKNGKTRKNSDYWTFSIYNVYARKNVYSYFYVQDEENPDLTEIKPYSIFGTIIPSVTYNFKF